MNITADKLNEDAEAYNEAYTQAQEEILEQPSDYDDPMQSLSTDEDDWEAVDERTRELMDKPYRQCKLAYEYKREITENGQGR